MKVFDWKNNINKEELKEVIDILNNNGVIIYPTETVYGLGGNALSTKVADEVYNVKDRPKEKSLSILLYNKKLIEDYAVIKSPIERKIIEKFMPRPITIILEKREDFKYDYATNNTIGIRIPKSEIINSILGKINYPLIGTSANISGKSIGNVKNIINNFNDKVDIIIDGGEIRKEIFSTIVKVENEEIVILREGSITKEEIENLIK